MGHCFSSCFKVPASYKPANNQAFHHRSSPQLSSPPTPIDVYNVIVEYDKNSNNKSKSLAQRHTTGSYLEDNTSTQLSHTHSKTSLSLTSLGDSNKKTDINDTPVPPDPVEEMFKDYRDADRPDAILAEGIKRLCKHLNLQPHDRKILSLAWKFKASTMSRFSRDEFVEGCRGMQVTSVQELRSKLEEMGSEEGKELKGMYKWCFNFGLDPPQRALPLDIALPLWSLVFHHHPPSLLSPWLRFLEDQKAVTLISKDTWDLFLTLTETYPTPDHLLKHYTDQEAWPSLFDDFVEYLKLQPPSSLQPPLCCGCSGDSGCGGCVSGGEGCQKSGERADITVNGRVNEGGRNSKSTNTADLQTDPHNTPSKTGFNSSNSYDNIDRRKRGEGGDGGSFKTSISSYCNRFNPCNTNNFISNTTFE